MTPDDLTAFRKRFHLKSKKSTAYALGCSSRAIYNYERGITPIPRFIALAASAFAMGLPAYGEKVK